MPIFTSKSVIDQQGCRALTFALAGLSCFIALEKRRGTGTRLSVYELQETMLKSDKTKIWCSSVVIVKSGMLLVIMLTQISVSTGAMLQSFDKFC